MTKFKHLLTHSSRQASASKLTAQNINQPISQLACLETKQLFRQFNTSDKRGLDITEVRRRQNCYGKNEAVNEKKVVWIAVLFNNLRDPLSLLLLALAGISFVTSDLRSTIMIVAMIILSVGLRFFQEIKADKAAKKLKALVHTTANALRNGKVTTVAIANLVIGDIVYLSAGDMVPADLILLNTKDLFINQSALTGESLPTEKHAQINKDTSRETLDFENVCFLGTNVESGSGAAIVVATGKNTYLGAIAKDLTNTEPPTNFDIGIKKFTYLIMTFIMVMVPLVFLLNGLTKGDWFQAILFSLAVAVGLAPEMLPMIVAVNLSKGALSMAEKKVVVKHLNSVQNFGAMDILCTDKTGTITEGRVVLEKFLNTAGEEDDQVLQYAYINSYFQTGLENLMDAAVLKHHEIKKKIKIDKNYKKIDEIPFDFARRRMSVVVENDQGEHLLICKGAIEEITALSNKIQKGEKIIDIKEAQEHLKKDIEDHLNSEGFRVVAVAYKKEPPHKTHYTVADEKNLILIGFLAFLDPPKASAKATIDSLKQSGIKVMVLTGDNELVTKQICGQVGLPTDKILSGGQIEKMNEDQLKQVVAETQIFAKLTPLHKEKIVSALRSLGHAVGFMGDGINDAPALRAADIGISVDSAADIAKESSDIILLEKSLAVLRDGVIEGRRILGNIVKYIEMAASSNFGNMFSVVGASFLLPFLPMLPIQILTNNILYDISQTAIPTDRVDEEYLLKPRQWKINHIKKFILWMGPVSSIFDFITFYIMIKVFQTINNPSLFQTGWFVESLVSQTLIIYVIRTNKIPFLQSSPSKPLLLTTLLIAAVGIYLPYSPLAASLGFTSLPSLYWLILLAMIFGYFVITQIIKTLFIKKYGEA